MDVEKTKKIIDVIDQYLSISLADSWPLTTTSETEFRNAFKLSQCMETVIKHFESNNVVEKLFSELQKNKKVSIVVLKACLLNAPKCVLKKIINSEASSCQLDDAIKIFISLFSEERFETCLTDIILEAASNNTLLQKLSSNINEDSLLEFKSLIILSELQKCENVTESTLNIIKGCNKNLLQTLLTSILNKDKEYEMIISDIVKALNTMLSRNCSNKDFWKALFNVKPKLLNKVCLQYKEIFKNIAYALIDCGKLIQEEMCSEYFYIDLTYEELKCVVRMLCKNNELETLFKEYICGDVEFWNDMLL